MALLHWEDEQGVVHGVVSEWRTVNAPRGDRKVARWVCACKARTFTNQFPPVFTDKESTCVICLAAE